MGYGKRALKQLKSYYEGKFVSLSDNATQEETPADGIESLDDEQLVGLLNEEIRPRKKVPTLLKRLHERRPENLDYIGTSYGLTGDLLRFWKRQQFVPVYLSQKANDLTGEHSCIMICPMKKDHLTWLSAFFVDFQRRILRLLGKTFNSFTTSLALSLLDNNAVQKDAPNMTAMSRQDLMNVLLPHEIQRLESYTRNQVEFRLILDLTYDVTFMYFQNKFPSLNLDAIQKAILVGVGLQHKTVDTVSDEFKMPSNQILAKFYDAIKKLTKSIRKIVEHDIEREMFAEQQQQQGDEGGAQAKANAGDLIKNANPNLKSMDRELEEAASELAKKQKKHLEKQKKESLQHFAIKGTDEDWSLAINSSKSSVISVKR